MYWGAEGFFLIETVEEADLIWEHLEAINPPGPDL